MGNEQNGAKKLKFAAVGAAVTGAAVVGLSAFGLPPWAIEMTRLWGPGFLMVAFVFAGIAYYVPRGVVKDFVVAQQDQAVAMGGIKDQLAVMAGQTGKLDELKSMMDEVLLHQRINGDRLKTIESRLYVGREDDTR